MSSATKNDIYHLVIREIKIKQLWYALDTPKKWKAWYKMLKIICKVKIPLSLLIEIKNVSILKTWLTVT